MYRLSNISFNDFSIVAGQQKGSNIAVSGMLDMPKRTGKVNHNWGDNYGVEPYVSATEIKFAGRDIHFVGLLQADTRGEAVTKLQNMYDLLDSITKLVTFETPYGSYQVYMAKPVVVKWLKYKGYCSINFTLREPVVTILTPSIPASSDTSVYGVDGVPFAEFGLYVSKVTGNYNRPGTNSQIFKAYTNEGYQLTKTKAQSITIDMFCIATDFAGLKTNIELLHVILAQAGLRTLNIDGRLLNAYATNGFKVTNIKVGSQAVAKVSLVMTLDKPAVVTTTTYLADVNSIEILRNNGTKIQV
jgi:hypothetical protein